MLELLAAQLARDSKIHHKNWIRQKSLVFNFQLRYVNMKLLDSLNENLQTVFLG
jgi:hypothetical protein